MSTIVVRKTELVDPLRLIADLWPDVRLYDKQREIVYSVWENDETVVPAGNMLGKDFVTALIKLAFFLSRHPCRVLSTSVDDTQLNDVLWGEVRRFIQTASYPLRTEDGGNLIVNDKHIRKVVNGNLCGLSYIRGRVADIDGAGLLGHHIARTGDGIPRTLGVGDECSAMSQVHYDAIRKWANVRLWIGNCYECNNFFKWSVKGRPDGSDKGGDIPRNRRGGYHRRIIRIKAEDSPNVKLGLKAIAEGREPSYAMLFPGVKSFEDYEENRLLWDPIQQCIGLDADWYEGAEIKMFPPDWLNRAEQIALLLNSRRRGVSIGCDPGEGGSESSWSVCDHKGLIFMQNVKTPDTSVIPDETVKLMRHYDVPASQVWFDRGGGGKQHVDTLRKRGYEVNTIAFGEPASTVDKYGKYKSRNKRMESDETKTIYKNRRAEMYGILRRMLDPTEDGFGIPSRYTELRRQLSPIPLLYDGEGQMYLLPKNKPTPTYKGATLRDLLGCSPDESDSLVLATFGLMEAAHKKPSAGAVDV